MKTNYFFDILAFLYIINQCCSDYIVELEDSKCTEFKYELANITSETSYCVVRSSQPLRVCTNCYSQIHTFKNKYNSLFDKKIKQGKVECNEILLQSDISTSLEDIFKVFSDVWSQGNCDQCYNDSGNFTKDYTDFMKLEKSVMECLQNYTNASLDFTNPNFETIWDYYYFDSMACTKCNVEFNNVKKFYHQMHIVLDKKINDKTKLWDGLCGDLGDMLNTTRYLWSKHYKCDNRTPDFAMMSPIFVIIVITLLFYCFASTYFHNSMKTVLYKQRRLRHFSKAGASVNILETLK